MEKTESDRNAIYNLRRRLHSQECDAAAVLEAAKESGTTEALEEIIGNWKSDEGDQAGILTTLVCDEMGDYILETERDPETRAGQRIRRRPSRITFVIQGRDCQGRTQVLAIPAAVAFANDDGGIVETDLIQPLVAKGKTSRRDVLRTVRKAFHISSPDADAEQRSAELGEFAAAVRPAIELALIPEKASGLTLTVSGQIHVTRNNEVTASLQAVTAKRQGNIQGATTRVGRWTDKSVSTALEHVVDNTLDALDDSAKRVEALD